jgi:hypothetical protein
MSQSYALCNAAQRALLQRLTSVEHTVEHNDIMTIKCSDCIGWHTLAACESTKYNPDPIQVFKNGSKYLVFNGHHRLQSAIMRGELEIEAVLI